MLLVDLWIVVMMLSGSECSTVRIPQLTGKHPTETNPESGPQRRSQSVELFFNKIEQRRRIAITTSNQQPTTSPSFSLQAIRLRSLINEVSTLVELSGDLVLAL